MSTHYSRLGYTERDYVRLVQMSRGALQGPEDLQRVIDGYEYMGDCRSDYHIQSVQSSLHASTITCIDAAILAYGLLELLFPTVHRRLLAIHRRDPNKDEECGHCVALYRGTDGRIGALSKSSFTGLGHRDAVFNDEEEIATSYARAYVDMGFLPLYFGVSKLEDSAAGLDWRFDTRPLNEISLRLQTTYQYAFELR